MKLQWLLFLLLGLVAARERDLNTPDTLEQQRAVVFQVLDDFLADPQNNQWTGISDLITWVEAVLGGLLDDKVIQMFVSDFLTQRSEEEVVENSAILDSDMPSMAPSDAPSMVPSDSPSSVPSMMPVFVLPSDIPSTAPAVWSEEVNPADKGIPEGFEACPSGAGSNAAKTSSMTVMYAYKLQIAKNVDVNSVVSGIEARIQSTLMKAICDSALAINHLPADGPGAVCGPSEDLVGDGPCYFISGKTQLLVDVDGVGDSASLYCESLEAIRVFIQSGAIEEEIGGVQTILSVIEESLVPDFCQVDTTQDGSETNPSEIGDPLPESSPISGDNTGTITIIVTVTILGLALFAGLVVYRRRRQSESPVEFDIMAQLRASKSDQKKNLFGSADVEEDFDFSSLPVSSVDTMSEIGGVPLDTPVASMNDVEGGAGTPTSGAGTPTSSMLSVSNSVLS